jgi:hypothetical protein
MRKCKVKIVNNLEVRNFLDENSYKDLLVCWQKIGLYIINEELISS